jgi:hypothetical protein
VRKVRLYAEGGGDGKDLKIRCQQGFHKLFQRAKELSRTPEIVACGGRQQAYDRFLTAHANRGNDYIGLLIDSEDPVEDLNKPWQHLSTRAGDSMPRPNDVADDQALLIQTCIETWMVADRASLRSHYRPDCFRENALLPLEGIETRDRHSIQASLVSATKACKNSYEKNKRSFELLGNLDPEFLKENLSDFARVHRILQRKLKAK